MVSLPPMPRRWVAVTLAMLTDVALAGLAGDAVAGLADAAEPAAQRSPCPYHVGPGEFEGMPLTETVNAILDEYRRGLERSGFGERERVWFCTSTDYSDEVRKDRFRRAVKFQNNLEQDKYKLAMCRLNMMDADVFKRSNLSFADIRDTKFYSRDFSGAQLIGVEAEGAWFNHSQMAGAQLCMGGFRDARFIDTKLQKATLTFADFSNATMSGSTLYDVDAGGAVFEWAILNGAWFTGAKLPNARLSNADLTGAEFRNAVLTNADLRHSILDDVAFDGAHLKGADLTGAWFQPRSLPGSDGALGIGGVQTLWFGEGGDHGLVRLRELLGAYESGKMRDRLTERINRVNAHWTGCRSGLIVGQDPTRTARLTRTERKVEEECRRLNASGEGAALWGKVLLSLIVATLSTYGTDIAPAIIVAALAIVGNIILFWSMPSSPGHFGHFRDAVIDSLFVPMALLNLVLLAVNQVGLSTMSSSLMNAVERSWNRFRQRWASGLVVRVLAIAFPVAHFSLMSIIVYHVFVGFNY